MKYICVALFILSCAVVIHAQFSKHLETLDVDMILKNDRILKNYIKCLLEKGPCTNEGRELKKSLPDVLKSACGECSVNERRVTRKMILHIQDHRPADWEKLEKKYDPTGEFTEAFKKSVDV